MKTNIIDISDIDQKYFFDAGNIFIDIEYILNELCIAQIICDNYGIVHVEIY